VRNIIVTAAAARDIERLEAGIKKKVAEKLKLTAQDPMTHARKLADKRIGGFRARAGDYRIVFDLSGSDLIVLRVGHRKEIYR